MNNYKLLSIPELEKAAIEIYHKDHSLLWNYSNENELGEVLHERRVKMNSHLKISDEIIIKLLSLDKMFIDSGNKAFEASKNIMNMYNNLEYNKNGYFDDYEIEVKLTPLILVPDSNNTDYMEPEDSSIECIINGVLESYEELDFKFDPRQELKNKKSPKWNLKEKAIYEPLQGKEVTYFFNCLFDDGYFLSIQDMIRINNIWTDIKVVYQHYPYNLAMN